MFLHHFLCQHTVVDVVHQVADTVDDDQVGLAHVDSLNQQLTAQLPLYGTHVEDIDSRQTIAVDEQFGLYHSVFARHHPHDAVLQDVLRRFVALLGVVPQHTQR